MIYLLFVVGFVLLILGAKWLVNGAVSVASRLGVSDLIIGLTIVSMGTSMPELIVNVIASAGGKAELAIGNILGSNIANVLLILGVTAVVCELPVRRNTILSEVPFSLAAALLVGFLANAALWYEEPQGLHISRGDGIIILFFFFLFMAYVFLIAKEEKQDAIESGEGIRKISVSKSILLILTGMAGLFLGGKWIVDGAVHFAQMLGMSEAFIGLTVVALGTSLPELVTSIMAALNKNTDIAVGNAVGSNIFNLLWILGISSIINPLPFSVTSNFDILMVIVSSSLILLMLIVGRKWIIKRAEGVVFLLVYAAYLYFVTKRG
jgi:cation:H+ antiporter